MAYACGVTLDFSRPGKPNDYASFQALSTDLRGTCLNPDCFMNLNDACAQRKAFCECQNEERPPDRERPEIPIIMHIVDDAASPRKANAAENPSLSEPRIGGRSQF